MFGLNLLKNKKAAAEASSRVDQVLEKIASSEEREATAAAALEAAVADKLKAREALKAEQRQALAAKVALLVAEKIAPAAERRDRAVYKSDEWLIAGDPIFGEVEDAETALFAALKEASTAYHELAAAHGVSPGEMRDIAPLPRIKQAYQTPGVFHGRRMMGGGRFQYAKERWALLFAQKRVSML